MFATKDTAEDTIDPLFAVRSLALDAWSAHLLRCATCARTDELCDVAITLVTALAEHLTIHDPRPADHLP